MCWDCHPAILRIPTIGSINNNTDRTLKTRLSIINSALLFSCYVFSPAVVAEGWYFGVKGGPVVLDLPSLDDPVNAGIIVGHDWGVAIGDIGIEAEATTTVANGKNDENGVDVKTGGLFATARTAGPIYVKARLGYAVYNFTGVCQKTVRRTSPTAWHSG